MTGTDIKIARIRAGLKGYELARLLGITPDRMSKIELGHIKPSNELVNKIKRTLKTL